MINRLSEIDLPKRLAGVIPRWVTAVATGFAVVGLAVVVRLAIELISPGVVPFALLFPAMLLATLLSGWLAGAVALVAGGGLSWWFVMEPRFSFALNNVADAVNLALFFAAGALIIAIAEAFRQSAHSEGEARRAQIEERELLLRELNHRVGNNFQIVSSVMELQLRRTEVPEARGSLEAALARIRSIAEAHNNLYSLGDAQEIDMRDYLGKLGDALAGSILDAGAIDLTVEVDNVRMSRDRAVALGLVVNELVTNAAKHAFPDGRPGVIQVRLGSHLQGWRLVVSDDGVGLPKDFARRGGLGWGIVRAFSKRAGGAVQARTDGGAFFELQLDGAAGTRPPPAPASPP